MSNGLGTRLFPYNFRWRHGFSNSSSPTIVYQHKTLAHESSIRLLQLQPARYPSKPLQGRLLEQKDYETAKFEAVSYVWGTQDPDQILFLEGKLFPVSEALHTTLVSIRHRFSTRLLWIDAVCINQEDDEEKMDQISRMGSIYKSAERVLIWLGEATANTTRAFEFVDAFSRRFGYTSETPSPLMKSFCSFENRNIKYFVPSRITSEGDMIYDAALSSHLEDILGRPWFTRLWIVQELLLAKSAVLICGKKKLQWEQFSYIIIILHEVMDKTVVNNPLKDALKSAWNIVQLQEQHKFGKGFFSTGMLLRAPISFLAFMSRQRCKEEKDRLFGILGLEDTHFRHIGIDSSLLKMSMSAEEAFTLLSALFLIRGSKRVSGIINFCGLSRRDQNCQISLSSEELSPTRERSFPSWALDISNPQTFQRFPWSSNKFNAGGEWDIGYKLRSATSLALYICQGAHVYCTTSPMGTWGDLDFFCGLWMLLKYQVGSVLQLAERLKSAANEERELSTAETLISELVAYDSMEVGHVQRLARTLLADGVALVPELDILDLSEEPPRVNQEDLQSLWALFEKNFLAEDGELRLRYEKLSKFPLSKLVQDESILVGATKPVMDAELSQNLSEEATQAWKVYVALRSVFSSGLFAVLSDGKLAIVPRMVAGKGGEIGSVPGLPMPQVLRATGLSEEVDGEQMMTCQLIGPAYAEGLMDGEGLTYTEIGDGKVNFPTTIIV